MIRSKAEYMYYLQADKEALKIGNKHPLLSPNSMLWLTDPIYRWERLLRKCEYWETASRNKFGRYTGFGFDGVLLGKVYHSVFRFQLILVDLGYASFTMAAL